MLLAVFVGGAIGTLARYGLLEAFPAEPGSWPWATFAANLLGAALIGLILSRFYRRLPLSDYHHPLLATGFCGGLTTFSAFQLELLEMLDRGEPLLAAAYAAASILAGLALVAGASALARRFEDGLEAEA